MKLQNTRKRLSDALVLILLMALPASAWAGGLYLYEVDPGNVGLASAGWAARAQDASTLYTNPAGMTRLKSDNELNANLQAMYTNLKFQADGGTTTSGGNGSSTNWIPAGNTYYVHSFSPDLKAGIGIIGSFGLALNYNDEWAGRYFTQKAKLQGMSIVPSVAYKVNDWLSVGAGVNIMYAMLEMETAVYNVLPFRHEDDGQLKMDKTGAWGVGANLGILIEPTKTLRFGLTYLSEVKLKFSAKPEWSNIGPVRRAALTAAGLWENSIDITVRAPNSLMFSAYHDINDKWAIMGNIGWQQWSRFGSIDVSVSDTSLTTNLNYKDTWHVALGTQYRVIDPLLLSFGVAYDSAMMDANQITPSLPSGESWRFGVGAKYSVSRSVDLSLAYELIWMGDLAMNVSKPLPGTVSGHYADANISVINAGITWRF